eukprot:6209365-Pleurochrysis_carterae.AAC.2
MHVALPSLLWSRAEGERRCSGERAGRLPLRTWPCAHHLGGSPGSANRSTVMVTAVVPSVTYLTDTQATDGPSAVHSGRSAFRTKWQHTGSPSI